MRDSRLKGRPHGLQKLTEPQAREVLARYAAGERKTDIAAAFGVGKTTIHNIVTGLTWAHLRVVSHVHRVAS